VTGGDILAYYNVCETCGAHLDPGERCDCEEERERERREADVIFRLLYEIDDDGQYRMAI